MQKPRIYISTSNFKTKHNNCLNEILRVEGPLFDSFEIASGHQTDHETQKQIEHLLSKNKTILLHNYAFQEKNNLMINLCHPDKEVRSQVEAYIKQMIHLTKNFGQDYYSIHGGFYSMRQGFDRRKEQRIFLNALENIMAYAENKKVYIGVENHVVEAKNKEKLYLYNCEEFQEMFREIKSPYLKMHLDVGHLKVSSEVYGFKAFDFIQMFSDKIMTVHIHDNDGVCDKHDAFSEDAYFLPYLKGLKGLLHVVLETWDQAYDKIKSMMERLAYAIKDE